MQSCWKDKPEHRPTFSEILHTLERFLLFTADYCDLNGLWSRGDEKDACSKDKGDECSKNGENDVQTTSPLAIAGLKATAQPNAYCIASL